MKDRTFLKSFLLFHALVAAALALSALMFGGLFLHEKTALRLQAEHEAAIQFTLAEALMHDGELTPDPSNPPCVHAVMKVAGMMKNSGFRLVSDHPLQPQGKADFQEEEALDHFRMGRNVIVMTGESESGEFVRSFFPLKASASCQSCHASGRTGSDGILGVLSISVPLEEHGRTLENARRFALIVGALFGLTLVLLLYILGWRNIRTRLIQDKVLSRLNQIDPLTGLHHRVEWFALLNEEINRTRRLKRPLSLAIFEIDHMSSINSHFGSPGGDGVLRHVAETLRQRVRAYDCLGRVSGTQFALAFPYLSRSEAFVVCERLRIGLADSPAMHEGKGIPFTVSIGLTELAAHGESAEGLFERAAGALYNARVNGHNRTELDDMFRVKR